MECEEPIRLVPYKQRFPAGWVKKGELLIVAESCLPNEVCLAKPTTKKLQLVPAEATNPTWTIGSRSAGSYPPPSKCTWNHGCPQENDFIPFFQNPAPCFHSLSYFFLAWIYRHIFPKNMQPELDLIYVYLARNLSAAANTYGST